MVDVETGTAAKCPWAAGSAQRGLGRLSFRSDGRCVPDFNTQHFKFLDFF
jgi:hypothetical protein